MAGQYKIIDTNNTKEIVLDRYTSIDFSENTQEFFVKNSSNKVGVINSDGTTKIETLYDSISLLDKEKGLYIIQQAQKYGVVKGGNVSVIYPEYDSIGLDNNISTNKYLILDTLIPVRKREKWGAFDKDGNMIYKIEYDSFGYNLTSIEIDGVKESVGPVLAIERCNGVVVKKSDKYGLIDLKGKELVPIAVEGIYVINGVEDEDEKYFMLYNGKELNVIERLIKAGLIEETIDNTENEEIKNIISNNLSNAMSGINGIINSTTKNNATDNNQ